MATNSVKTQYFRIETNRVRIVLDRLTVFCWHNVAPTFAAPFDAQAARDGFAEQVRFLVRLARVLPLETALDALRAGELGPRAVALTFDDGYRDNLEVAAPILADNGVTATIFCVPDFLSRNRSPWWETLAWGLRTTRHKALSWRGQLYPLDDQDDVVACFAELAAGLKCVDERTRSSLVSEIVTALDPEGLFPHDELMLDWTDARELADAGFGIGAHTMSHAILARETEDNQHRDLAQCRETLRRELQLPIRTLAYPNGGKADYSDTSITAAKHAGFDFAFAGRDGWNGPRTPRFAMHRVFATPTAGTRAFARVLKRLTVAGLASGDPDRPRPFPEAVLQA